MKKVSSIPHLYTVHNYISGIELRSNKKTFKINPRLHLDGRTSKMENLRLTAKLNLFQENITKH